MRFVDWRLFLFCKQVQILGGSIVHAGLHFRHCSAVAHVGCFQWNAFHFGRPFKGIVGWRVDQLAGANSCQYFTLHSRVQCGIGDGRYPCSAHLSQRVLAFQSINVNVVNIFDLNIFCKVHWVTGSINERPNVKIPTPNNRHWR